MYGGHTGAANELNAGVELLVPQRVAHAVESVAETIAHLSGLVELAAGDLILMGTPEGVAAVGPGDRLEAAIEGLGELAVTIA